ncbi:MAG: N-acetylglucosamine-6-phosphate deacetylase [Clostridia bacterium]|nr:N-acetylglucosamine-6-phosphate deacetylase [Clostridia bacterium]
MTNKSLLIKNARAILSDRITNPTDILIENGLISKIGNLSEVANVDVFDVEGDFVFPGFVDVHIHGGGGADFMDGTADAFETAVKAHLKRGTTMLVPTAMTASKAELLRFVDAFLEFKKKSEYASLAAGIHLEGPYFSTANSKSKGAQNGSIIRDIDFDELEEILEKADGNVIRWDAAPEVENADEFAKLMHKKGIICAVAHTDATAEETQKGFDSGFSHVTHFYNAVTAYKKRDQVVTAGVVEATYVNDKVTVELICDGKHIPKYCMQLALKIKGADNVVGITDATRISCTQMTSGKLGSLENGSEVIVDDGVAKLPDLTSFAGSICTMDRALRVLCVDYGIDEVTAAKMLASSPAKHINMFDKLGSIDLGKLGDLVVVGSNYSVKNVIKLGNIIQ